MKKEFYAHSLPGRPKEEWQRLEDHLKNVAELAREFAEPWQQGRSRGELINIPIRMEVKRTYEQSL